MKQSILEKLSKLSDYISKATPDELAMRLNGCAIDSNIADSYARLETEVLSCSINLEVKLASNSFGNDAGNDYAMAA